MKHTNVCLIYKITCVRRNKDDRESAEPISSLFHLKNSMRSLIQKTKRFCWDMNNFITFVAKWGRKYPILKSIERPQHRLLYIYGLPVQVQRCIYTTNWIERLNRKYKRTIRMRTSMPLDKSALSLPASAAMEETETTCVRKIHQWKFWRKKNE